MFKTIYLPRFPVYHALFYFLLPHGLFFLWKSSHSVFSPLILMHTREEVYLFDKIVCACICVCVCVCVCMCTIRIRRNRNPTQTYKRDRKFIVEWAEHKKCLYFYHNPEICVVAYFLSDYCLVFFSIGFSSKLGFTWYLQC